jgi:hypothetical protein
MGTISHIASLSESSKARTDTDASGANNPGYTFAAMDFGEAAADRYIIAAVDLSANSGSLDATSVTIGGVSATEATARTFTSGSVSHYAGLWIAAVPSGTSGDVVVNASTTLRDGAVTTYRVTGIASATPTDTDFDESASTSTYTMDLDTTYGGIVIATGNNEDQTTGYSWTGVDEDDDYQIDNIRFSAASRRITSPGLAQAVSCTTGTSRGVAVCAHWAQG